MLEKALRLCEAPFGILATYDGERFHFIGQRGLPPSLADFLREPQRPRAGTAAWRVVHGGGLGHITDLMEQKTTRRENPVRWAMVELGGARTTLAIPLRKDDVLLGTFFVYRQEVRPFSGKQIALLQNFAAQAVIAMENARLLDEIRQRQAELRVTFDNMADGVAMFDGGLRLAAWNRNFQQILDLPDAVLAEHHSFDTYIRYLADRGEFGNTTPE